MITFLRAVRKAATWDLTDKRARDIFWMLTGGDVYRMLVRERGWSPQKYEDWLADTLARSLLTRARANPVRNPAAKCGTSEGNN